jgi:signal transduction histidine kinase/ActR/RegA family two-component response regulator
LLRSCFVFFASIIFLFIINKYTSAWCTLAHISIIFITLSVYSNLSLYVQNINVATLQFIWLGCVFGFYMLGLKWGWFYAFINILPVLAYHIIDHHNFFLIGSGPQKINQTTYFFVITYNFFIIIFLHYFFFKAFNNNFTSLTEAKNQLNELNNKLKETLVDVEKLSKSRMDFLSTMTHELRTPLNGVIGISNVLLLQNPREDQQENLSILKFSAENLLSLVNNVLDFNKLDSEKTEIEIIPFHLATLARNNYASVTPKIKEKNLDFHLFIDQEIEGKIVYGDPTRLTQVLLNLLNNAINFTEKGSVKLFLQYIPLSENHFTVRFTIEDTGIGIDPDSKEKIFEPYIQANTHINRNYGGTGLGLPIVKKILEVLGSSITLESTPFVGSKFSFKLNFRYEVNKVLQSNTNLFKRSLPGLHVLIVEDNAVNIRVLEKTLEHWDIKTKVAENGLIALEELKNQDFDVILMDIYMPLMDGYEATRAIRNLNSPQSKIPIIALSATLGNDIIAKVKDAGMDDYISKPFSLDQLFNKLQKIYIEKL